MGIYGCFWFIVNCLIVIDYLGLLFGCCLGCLIVFTLVFVLVCLLCWGCCDKFGCWLLVVTSLLWCLVCLMWVLYDLVFVACLFVLFVGFLFWCDCAVWINY